MLNRSIRITACMWLLGTSATWAAGIENWFVSKAETMQVFEAFQQNDRRIDHGDWQAWLDVYVQTDHPSGINRVRYGAVDEKGSRALQAYLRELQDLDPRALNRAEQMAYWINLYNALTVQVIIDNPNVDSIREIKSGWFSAGPWKRKLANVAGIALSLDNIEHNILRPIFKDARIHFAVNCASLGCPDLAATAFTGVALQEQLDAAQNAYLSHPRGIRFEGEQLVLSSIFDWYGSDFGSDEQGVVQYLATHAPADLATRLRGHTGRPRYEYDWQLNKP